MGQAMWCLQSLCEPPHSNNYIEVKLCGVLFDDGIFQYVWIDMIDSLNRLYIFFTDMKWIFTVFMSPYVVGLQCIFQSKFVRTVVVDIKLMELKGLNRLCITYN